LKRVIKNNGSKKENGKSTKKKKGKEKGRTRWRLQRNYEKEKISGKT